MACPKLVFTEEFSRIDFLWGRLAPVSRGLGEEGEAADLCGQQSLELGLKPPVPGPRHVGDGENVRRY